MELIRIKEQLQKTMDGIEVEKEEEEDKEMLKFELKKLIDLEEWRIANKGLRHFKHYKQKAQVFLVLYLI